MSNVPWSNETERADYWQNAWKTEHKENERLQVQIAKLKQEKAELKKDLDEYENMTAEEYGEMLAGM